MTKFISTTATENLPTWDTFEAVFFIAAGLSVGIVFGILFPSLWRSFRRGFRKQGRYAPQNLDTTLTLALKIIPADIEDAAASRGGAAGSTAQPYLVSIAEAFVLARNFFQIGNAREAIVIYIDILTYENVSKQDTNRALYELSQIYFSIGLLMRSFETAMELLNRKPANTDVLQHILKICMTGFFPDNLQRALLTYQGTPNKPLRFSIAHALSKMGEVYLSKGQMDKALECARNAVKWERQSGRAMILLWQATSNILWQRAARDPQMLWLALAADLEALSQINHNTSASPAAGAEYLASLLEQISSTDGIIESFSIVKDEFLQALKQNKSVQNSKKDINISIFHAVLFLHKNSPQLERKFLSEVLEILSGEKSYLYYIAQQSEAAYIGYAAHYCEKCYAFFTSFVWKCTQCGMEETLTLVVIPRYPAK